MDHPPNTGKAWELTGAAFAKLLAGLDPDPERAGEKYEELRLRLIKLCDWRGAQFPEECADETLNRVARKLDEGATIQDLPTYCQGVARLVFLEKLKHPERRRADLEELAPLAAPEPQESDERQECFEQCLRELPPESRQLIMHYYQDDKRAKINNRLALAERLGIPLNALRSRAQRIRDRLEECINQCQKKIQARAT
jgi:DNA-directed RNA polymerase specialized sigma24 family protein